MTHREGSEPLAEAWQQHWPRLVALLVGQFRRLELAEDALADAFEAAARTWPERGVPDNPAGWLLASARRRALDRIRAEAVAARKQRLLVVDAELQARAVRADPGDLVGDDTLRLVLMCAHPTLSPESAAALSLRLVLGVPTADIARLFLISHATMSARLTRAAAGWSRWECPWRCPAPMYSPSGSGRLRTWPTWRSRPAMRRRAARTCCACTPPVSRSGWSG